MGRGILRALANELKLHTCAPILQLDGQLAQTLCRSKAVLPEWRLHVYGCKTTCRIATVTASLTDRRRRTPLACSPAWLKNSANTRSIALIHAA